jgi:hypothetical protein
VHLFNGLSEYSSKNDKYGIAFPEGASEEEKCLIVYCVLLIDYLLFCNFWSAFTCMSRIWEWMKSGSVGGEDGKGVVEADQQHDDVVHEVQRRYSYITAKLPIKKLK